MRKWIDYFPKDVNAAIPPAVDLLIKKLSPGVPKALWSSLHRKWKRVTFFQEVQFNSCSGGMETDIYTFKTMFKAIHIMQYIFGRLCFFSFSTFDPL